MRAMQILFALIVLAFPQGPIWGAQADDEQFLKAGTALTNRENTYLLALLNSGKTTFPYPGVLDANMEVNASAGVFGSTWSIGWALTPFLGLEVRSAYGDATMWMCVAAVGVTAGILGLIAARGHDAEAAGVGSPA